MPVLSLSDESLLAGMGSGDPEAAAAFVRRFQARVYGMAFTVLSNRALAEETAQEAFVRAWRHADAYDPRKGRVATWLLTITRNLAVDAARLRREHPVDPGELTVGTLSGHIADQRADFEEACQLSDALRSLPVEQTRAVVLSVYYALTPTEVAELEHVPLGTAKTRLRRGLARLREVLTIADD